MMVVGRLPFSVDELLGSADLDLSLSQDVDDGLLMFCVQSTDEV
jgi:hypothetical protein